MSVGFLLSGESSLGNLTKVIQEHDVAIGFVRLGVEQSAAVGRDRQTALFDWDNWQKAVSGKIEEGNSLLGTGLTK